MSSREILTMKFVPPILPTNVAAFFVSKVAEATAWSRASNDGDNSYINP